MFFHSDFRLVGECSHRIYLKHFQAVNGQRSVVLQDQGLYMAWTLSSISWALGLLGPQLSELNQLLFHLGLSDVPVVPQVIEMRCCWLVSLGLNKTVKTTALHCFRRPSTDALFRCQFGEAALSAFQPSSASVPWVCTAGSRNLPWFVANHFLWPTSFFFSQWRS